MKLGHATVYSAIIEHAERDLGLSDLEITQISRQSRAKLMGLEKLLPDTAVVRENFRVTGKDSEGRTVDAIIEITDLAETRKLNLESAYVFVAALAAGLTLGPIPAALVAGIPALRDLIGALRKKLGGKHGGKEVAATNIALKHLAGSCGAVLYAAGLPVGGAVKLFEGAQCMVEAGHAAKHRFTGKDFLNALKGLFGVHGAHHAPAKDDLRVVTKSVSCPEEDLSLAYWQHGFHHKYMKAANG